MDFLKKKMKELMDDDDKKPKDSKEGHSDAAPPQENRGYSDQYQQPYQQPYQQQGYQGYPPQGYQQGPPQGYPQPGFPQQQHSYGSPAPPQGPPAPYGAPPPMPPGWVAQWDQNGQRWYYVEQATGRSQWEPPAGAYPGHPPQGPYAPPPSGPYGQPAPGQDERGLFGTSHDQQGYNQGPVGEVKKEKKDKDKGHSTAMLAGAGVAGVAAGAWIGHELTEDSDDDKKVQYVQAAPAAAAPMAAAPAAAPYQDPYAMQEPPPVPTHDADGDSISSSDRESLEEKREELIEAQEEYEEELEEAYDD